MSDILRPSASHMFCSEVSSAGGDKSETFRALKVLINLINVPSNSWWHTDEQHPDIILDGLCSLDVVMFSPTLFLTTDMQFFVLFCFFLHVYCRCVGFEFLRFQFGMPWALNEGNLSAVSSSAPPRTNLMEMWHVGLETVSHSTVTSWP